MYLLIRWALNAGVLLLIPRFVEGIGISSFYAALITILVLGLVNAIIRPIILFFTLPLNILSIGLFTFVVNALMFWLVATIVKGFDVAGFWPAFWGALILTVASWIFSWFLKE